MRPDDVGDARRRWRRTDHRSRPGAQRGEHGGGDRRMPLVARMEPIGATQVARAAVGRMEIVDRVEAIEADEGCAVLFTGLRDDGVEAGRWEPAADAEHAGVRPGQRADDRLVLRRKDVFGRIEPHIVGAELDRHQRRVRGRDGAQLGNRPGGLGAAARDQVEIHAQLVGHQRGKCPVLSGREPPGADAVAERDIDLALQALGIGGGGRADHLAGGHRRAPRGRLPDGKDQ